MPISSGFAGHDASSMATKPIVQPQIVSRAAKFRINQRNQYRNGLSATSKAVVAERAIPVRPTAIRAQPSRSDTFTLPKKHVEATGFIPDQGRAHGHVARQLAGKNYASFAQSKPSRTMLRQSKQRDTSSSSSSPRPSRRAASVAEPTLSSDTERSRRIQIGDDQYVMRTRRHSPSYAPHEHRSVSPPSQGRTQRVIRIVREPHARPVEEPYYVEPEPKHVVYEHPRHRPTVIRGTYPPPEYFYVDEIPVSMGPVRQRYPQRSRLAYIGNDRPMKYEEETIYVDEHGNEIQYIYETESPGRGRPDHKPPYYPPPDNVHQ